MARLSGRRPCSHSRVQTSRGLSSCQHQLIHASGKCALAVDGQAHVRTVRRHQGTNTVIGPLPPVTLRQSGAFSEHFELLRHQEHRVRCKHVAHMGILWATTESSTTSRPQGQAKNTSAHRNTHGHSVKGTYIECFEHVEKEESVLRMPQMPTPAQQWVTKKSPRRISGSATNPRGGTTRGCTTRTSEGERRTEPSKF